MKVQGTGSDCANTPPLGLARYVASRAATYDSKHGELATQELGLSTARVQSSPGGARSKGDDAESELEIESMKANRSVTARVSYLAADRPEILYATKECGKAATCATRSDLTSLRRIGRYLLKKPRCVWNLPHAGEDERV